MQKDNDNPKEKQCPEDKDTKRFCTSPCRHCVKRHTCPDVCPILKKTIEA